MRVKERTRVSLMSVHRIYSFLTGCFFYTNKCEIESTNMLANNTQNWREPSKRAFKNVRGGILSLYCIIQDDASRTTETPSLNYYLLNHKHPMCYPSICRIQSTVHMESSLCFRQLFLWHLRNWPRSCWNEIPSWRDCGQKSMRILSVTCVSSTDSQGNWPWLIL